MPSRRERYETANMRGGLGVRKRLSEESMRDTYRLNGVQTGSAIVRAHDKYLADFTKGFDVGVLVRKTASSVTIQWLGDEEATVYSQGDARYEVDRGRWRILGPVQGNPLDPNNPLADTLTRLRQSHRVQASGQPPDTPPTEESDSDMAKEQSNAAAEREAAKKALKNGDLKERDTYTAKQVATRCGTDSKTMRKFFRSNHSTVEPVGQGGRYEFDSRDFPKIKREFDAWSNKSKNRATQKPSVPITEVMEKAKKNYIESKTEEDERAYKEDGADADHPSPFIDSDVHQAVKDHFGDDREPTDEELEAMARLMDDELDLDD